MNTAEQKTQMDMIMKLGMFHRNINNQRNGIELIPMRKQSSQNSLKLCSICTGPYKSMTVSRHMKKCPQSVHKTTVPGIAIKPNLMLAPSCLYRATNTKEEFKIKVLNRFLLDKVGDLCRSDQYIITVGYRQWEKNENDNKRPMSCMRSLARLTAELRDIQNNENLTFLDVIHKKNFFDLELALDTLCYDDKKSDKYGMRLIFGNNILSAATILKGVFMVMEKTTEQLKQVEEFLFLLKLEWSHLFGKSLKKAEQVRDTKSRRPVQLPHDDDLKTIRKYVSQQIQMLSEEDDLDFWNEYRFNRARALVVCRLTLFNARRGDEGAKCTLAHYEDAKKGVWIDPKKCEKIEDPMEKMLLGKFLLSYVDNKRGKKLIPVLIPNDCVKVIDKMIDVRTQVGINPKNPYLFPSTRNSEFHCRGWDMVQEIVSKLELEEPRKITATAMRHKMSTDYSALDLSPSDREAFYKHMGHDEAISHNVYQCPPGIQEVVRVGRFFSAADSGNIPKNGCCRIDDLLVDDENGKTDFFLFIH